MKQSIAERRWIQVKRLKEMNPKADAERLMNSYYRLCGLCETNLYLANDERTCNTKRCAASEAREEKWHKRLNAEFYDAYGLNLVYTSYYPRIGKRDERGGFTEVINVYFYD